MLADDTPETPDLFDEAEVWEAYEAKDQDLRRARWTALLAGWALSRDRMVEKLLESLDLPELIDLDSSLTSLRYEIRKVIAKQGAPDSCEEQADA